MRNFARTLPVLVLMACWGSFGLGQSAPTDHFSPHVPSLATYSPQLAAGLRSQIDAAVQEAVQTAKLPSASIAVVKDGKIVYTQAYGDARLQPPTPALPDMRYSIGSISKQFTAVAVLMLQDEGKLNIDDKISKWLPDLTRANDITLREVLSHTSGYQDFWPEDYVMTTMMQPATAEHILKGWGGKPLDFEPGTQWQYSNTNYVIAGRIVEIVTKQDLFQFLQQRIFAPLNMQSVMNQDFRRLPDTDAEGYYRHALGPLRPAPKEGFGWMFAAGELAMTAHDLAVWDIALMNSDPRIVSPRGWHDLEEEVKLKNGKGTDYALGVQVAKFHGQQAIFHSGEVSGFVAMNIVFPELRGAICVLTNLDASDGASKATRAIAPLVFAEMRTPAKPAATAAKPDAKASAPAAAPPKKPALSADDSALQAQARQIFLGLQQAKVDRPLMTKLTNDYFTQEALDDYAQSLAPLGAPVKFEQVATEPRGGMVFHSYAVSFANGKSVEVTTYIEPDGKIEQYLVSPE
jgi:D-alanyl-D-alanine carboxypeptidase